jgi:glutamyl-tRNA synthetase
MADGRFAPSPTGPLHLGNLRTALLAWLFARSAGSRFLVRVEDLDQVASRPGHEASHLADLLRLGLDWDGEVVRQSERLDRYDAALAQLASAGLTYPCYCTRREIREAVSAPHAGGPASGYPGTCRSLSAQARRQREHAGRAPALRLASDGRRIDVDDRVHGRFVGVVADVVLRRNDGAPAYQLAVVVDDADQGVEEVVRGDDLLSSTATQLFVAEALGVRAPSHAHVPLVLGPDGERLAKRHGAVTLSEREARGHRAHEILAWLAWSLGLAERGEAVTARVLLERFDPAAVPRRPWRLAPDDVAST